MLWLSNSSFRVLWEFHPMFYVFPCLNLTMHLPFQEESMIPFHLLKSMVNKHMKWRTFWIHGSLIINPSILFIGMGMMWMNTLGDQSRTYQMLWRRCMSFINNIWTNPSSFLVERIVKRGSDVIDANAMSSFIWMIIHDL